MRICPHCTYPMEVIRDTNNVELDHCRRCKGLFFDPGEAKETFGPLADPSVWKSQDSTMELGASDLHCPHDDALMHSYVISSDSDAVQVELCPTCNGLWLDAGESKKLVAIGRKNQEKKDQKDEDEKDPESPGFLKTVFLYITGLPLEVYNPVRKHTYALYTIIGLIILCFLGELWFFSRGATELVVYKSIGVIPKEIMEGQRLWTLISHAFFHAGWAHILGNLYFLYVFGDNVEDTMGTPKFLILYILSGLAAVFIYMGFKLDSTIPMLGASGAISGLLGAYIILFPKVKVWIVFFFMRFKLSVTIYLGFWIGMQVVMAWVNWGKSSGGVAWMAHIGGFVAGLLLALLMRNSSPVVKLRSQSS